MLKKLSRAGVYMMSVILLVCCIFMVTGCNNPHHPYKDKRKTWTKEDNPWYNKNGKQLQFGGI